MATNKFLTFIGNDKQLVTAIATSVGVGDANKIIATGSDGLISTTLMPVGIGADTQTAVAFESLSAGDFVNIFDNGGVTSARRADADNNRPAHGFVLASFAGAATAVVFRAGTNNTKTGLTIGAYYYLSVTAGSESTSAPALSGNNLIQGLGSAVSATAIAFQPTQVIIAV